MKVIQQTKMLYKFLLSPQTTAETAELQKKLKEKEEMNSKLKQLAIKAKKELGDKQAKVWDFFHLFNVFYDIKSLWMDMCR